MRTRRGRSSSRSRRTSQDADNQGREIPSRRSWWRPMTLKGDFRHESTTTTLHCGKMMCKNEYENTNIRERRLEEHCRCWKGPQHLQTLRTAAISDATVVKTRARRRQRVLSTAWRRQQSWRQREMAGRRRKCSCCC